MITKLYKQMYCTLEHINVSLEEIRASKSANNLIDWKDQGGWNFRAKRCPIDFPNQSQV